MNQRNVIQESKSVSVHHIFIFVLNYLKLIIRFKFLQTATNSGLTIK